MASRKVGAAPDLAPTPASGGVADINVTPLIDVLLVLLIISVISFGLSRRTLPVELPAEVGGQPFPQIMLELSDDGRYLLNGQPVPRDQLPDLLSAVFRARPVKVLFIKTGGTRTYQEFIQAADLAKGAGVTIVAAVGSY